MARLSPEDSESPLRRDSPDTEYIRPVIVDDDASGPSIPTPAESPPFHLDPLEFAYAGTGEFNHPGSPPPTTSYRAFKVLRASLGASPEGDSRGKITLQGPDIPPKKAQTKADKKAALAMANSGTSGTTFTESDLDLSPRPSFLAKQRQHIPEFVYTHDFDTCGIIYYLGTNRFVNKKWVNPALLGLIEISSSEMNQDSQPLHCFVGREPVRALLANLPNSWWMLDFKDHLVVPRHYSLRHYISQDSHALRSWRLDASVDGENWECIKTHKNDKSLNRKGATHTWPIDTYSITKHSSKAYRMFRLQMTGENSSDYFHNLCCSGFEMYGFMYEKEGYKADEEGDVWIDTPLPIEEGGGITQLSEDEIAIGEALITTDELKYTECELFKNEFFMASVDDLAGRKDGEDTPRKERSEASSLVSVVQQQFKDKEGLGVHVVDFEPPEISDEKLREDLKRTPQRTILRDPRKGYKINKIHIKFADEMDSSGLDAGEKPELVTVVLVDQELCHHGQTRGRKCPNSASRGEL